LNIHDIYGLFFKFTRSRRMQKFEQILLISNNCNILDVGGAPGNWYYTKAKPYVTMLNTKFSPKVDKAEGRFKWVEGNALTMPYSDNEFDVVFSNSVIEHVGDFTEQQKFALACRRIGCKIFIQTPAKIFPIEPHYITPFVHWFPKKWQKMILRHFSVWGLITHPTKYQVNNMVEEINLLTYKQMKQLFPDCQILIDRFFFWPKAYIAIRI
jgi:hypothetical protein